MYMQLTNKQASNSVSTASSSYCNPTSTTMHCDQYATDDIL